ncbi:hypothetical protein OUZ56_023875 [Daphnia magna]|uniref:Uncharacterized protein n=1 Tax=Daphnia magna TaxID=35525 RepID=A0ABR0AZR9_9CRUS|nr:hypothetical protein OUZ56_023875 [Daphnia magna]
MREQLIMDKFWGGLKPNLRERMSFKEFKNLDSLMKATEYCAAVLNEAKLERRNVEFINAVASNSNAISSSETKGKLSELEATPKRIFAHNLLSSPKPLFSLNPFFSPKPVSSPSQYSKLKLFSQLGPFRNPNNHRTSLVSSNKTPKDLNNKIREVYSDKDNYPKVTEIPKRVGTRQAQNTVHIAKRTHILRRCVVGAPGS